MSLVTIRENNKTRRQILVRGGTIRRKEISVQIIAAGMVITTLL